MHIIDQNMEAKYDSIQLRINQIVELYIYVCNICLSLKINFLPKLMIQMKNRDCI